MDPLLNSGSEANTPQLTGSQPEPFSEEEVADDPTPPGANATPVERGAYLAELLQYSDESLTAFKGSKMSGEDLWGEFTTTFRPEGIQNLNVPSVIAWRDLLIERNVYVAHGRLVHRKTALINCLKAVEFPRPEGTRTQGTLSPTAEGAGDHTNQNEEQSNRECRDNGESSVRSNASSESYRTSQISRTYQSRAKFGGSFDDDLHGALQTYETFSEMYGLNEVEMSASLPLILDGDALTFYAARIPKSSTYGEKVKLLQEEFTSEERRNRLLRIWQGMSLKAEMVKHPEKSQVEVFKLVYRSLSKIQNQLHADYHADRFLRDQIVISADLPQLEKSMKERAATTTQEATQRIAALLLSDPGSAGSIREFSVEANYGLGRRFEGAARKTMSGTRAKNHKNTWKGPRKKGCWVCGLDHFARDHHTSDEITTALKTLKSDRAFVSAESVSEIFCADKESSDDSIDDGADESNFGLVERTNDLAYAFSTLRSHRHIERDGIFLSLSCQGMTFNGVIIDTGANRRSTMCLEQYRAYCARYGSPHRIQKQARSIRGIGGSVRAVGIANLPIPFSDLNVTIDVEFLILPGAQPTLLSLRDMMENEIGLDILNGHAVFGDHVQKLHFVNGFWVHRWEPGVFPSSYFTEEELRKLHRSFGHPSVTALTNVLRRARPNESAGVRAMLDSIVQDCKVCSLTAAKPRHFKLVATRKPRVGRRAPKRLRDCMTVSGRTTHGGEPVPSQEGTRA
jgi:hypothetical protein